MKWSIKGSSYLRPLLFDYGQFKEWGYGLYTEQSGDNKRQMADVTNFYSHNFLTNVQPQEVL